MKTNLTILAWLLLPGFLPAQDLVANGGFEDRNKCTEYKATCAPEAWFWTPQADISIWNTEFPATYKGKYAEAFVFENQKHPRVYRVFLYTMLLCPLREGETYVLSFYLNPIYLMDYEVGVLFSKGELIDGIAKPLEQQASLICNETNEVWKNKKTNWRKITIEYQAKGGEQFLTFGNFSPDAYAFDKKTKANNNTGDLVFLIDNVALQPKVPEKTPYCLEYESNRALVYDFDYRHTSMKGILDSLPTTAVEPSVVEAPEAPTPPLEPEKAAERTFEIPDLAFDFNSFELNGAYFDQLDALIAEIKTLKPSLILIYGHTDDVGSAAYNLQLSSKRAETVKTYIQKHYPEYRGGLIAEGKGENEPKVDNLSEANRAKNRRVEIIIRQ